MNVVNRYRLIARRIAKDTSRWGAAAGRYKSGSDFFTSTGQKLK
ncbi:hypothetical protein [Peribacillus faecalis]|nr:hypothetical protein [Peribacillus faecalis]